MRDDNAGDNMDATSAQLHEELRAAVIDGLSTRRPILHHLSADTAWLLQIPRPYQATKRGGRLYFNILIDPWLSGTQTDITSWLSTQWHAVKPRVPSVAAVEELIREIEVLASGLRPNLNTRSPFHDAEAEDSDMPTCIDAVAISHEFTDHCHQETLLTVHADVPVFATEVRVLSAKDHIGHANTAMCRKQRRWCGRGTTFVWSKPFLTSPAIPIGARRRYPRYLNGLVFRDW